MINTSVMTSLEGVTWYGVVQQEGDCSTDKHTRAQQNDDDLVQGGVAC